MLCSLSGLAVSRGVELRVTVLFEPPEVTYQDDAAVSFVHSLAGFWLFGTNAELLTSWCMFIEAIALQSEDVELVRLDVKRLGRRLGVDEGCLGEGHSLSFCFGLLNQAVGAHGSLPTSVAARALGRAAFLHSGREHDDDVERPLSVSGAKD